MTLGAAAKAGLRLIERPAQPADHSALARGIPAFQHDDGAVRRAKVRLLHALQGFLRMVEELPASARPVAWR